MGNQRGHVPYLQALLAWLATASFVALYWAIDRSAGEGWFHDFLIAFLPGAAVVSGAYALLYWLFARRGLTRDQQLGDAVADAIASRLQRAVVVEEVRTGTEEPDWTRYLSEADRLDVAARSLARWTSAVDDALRSFFAGAGTMRVFAHDPRNDGNLRAAAAGRSGYEDDAPARVRSNVVAGLKRLSQAAERHPRGRAEALDVCLLEPDAFVFPASLFVFSRGGAMQRVVVRPHQFVRREVTAGPLFVLDAGRDGALRDHYAEDLERLATISKRVPDHELDSFLRAAEAL